MCPPEKLSCVKNISVSSDNDCLNKCDGLYITGYERLKFEEDQVEAIMSKIEDDYEFYKSGGNLKLPAKIGGINKQDKLTFINKQDKLTFSQFLEWKNLQLISIYFYTPGYDEITKDSAAKFVDQLSAIGGTFGLLTGFSLISGVEILFFLAKFLVSLAPKRSSQKKVEG